MLDDSAADAVWWPDHTLIPFADPASRAILDHALTCLVMVRGGDLRDPGAAISTLVTLISEAEARLPDVVVDARVRGYTWSRIAERLGCTNSAARHRFADHAHCRQAGPPLRLSDQLVQAEAPLTHGVAPQ